MKKSFLILVVLALLASACTNPLAIDFDQKPEILVMNSMLSTEEYYHYVRLSISRLDETFALIDAQVDCYVNGELVAHAEGMPEYYRESEIGSYMFQADFHPGDEIRLEARKDALHASATVTVPQPAAIIAVDTVSIAQSPYYPREEDPVALSCKLHLQDIPGQSNWFRLVALFEETFYMDGWTKKKQKRINFGFDQDPILADGHPSQQSRNSFSEVFDAFSTPNTFLSFRDTAFADGIGEPEIHIPYTAFTAFDDLIFYGMNVQKAEKSVRFVLFSISREEYDYLEQVAKSRIRALGALSEPTHIPSNVEGGLGFVSVSSASTHVITLPPKLIPTNL